ncbi:MULTISPECIES: RNA 2',3'-cyclic phosphodiesterase [Dickeya]|uniref:RNA 2',3'-cyclic phosphodiesterase n=1 Tax=Dickeya aquatica TaxID=1401087 RepID=A0A375A7Q7_9GAMM|nr:MULTISPECIES: RNA 2',3'-cyclic phosphodiesterase [Dickeya]SLM62050.1 2'-5' RNA ligase [Dickeya aquatica]
MPATRRLFFALPLPESISEQIVQWRAAYFPAHIGRPVLGANLHLTLAFLGEVSDQKAQVLQTLAGRIRQPAFTLTLNDAGHWPRPGVVWLGCRQAPRGLLQLANMLRSQAARNGCYQSPQPFHPHITLLRGVDSPLALPAATFRWTVQAEQFLLYESHTGAGRTRYHPIACWPLLTA